MNRLMHLESIEQGNIFTDKMIAQLSIGMSPEEVRSIMGEPVLKTPFHKNQWVYAYQVDHRFGDIEQKHVTLLFENGRVSDIKTELNDLFGA